MTELSLLYHTRWPTVLLRQQCSNVSVGFLFPHVNGDTCILQMVPGSKCKRMKYLQNKNITSPCCLHVITWCHPMMSSHDVITWSSCCVPLKCFPVPTWQTLKWVSNRERWVQSCASSFQQVKWRGISSCQSSLRIVYAKAIQLATRGPDDFSPAPPWVHKK